MLVWQCSASSFCSITSMLLYQYIMMIMLQTALQQLFHNATDTAQTGCISELWSSEPQCLDFWLLYCLKTPLLQAPCYEHYSVGLCKAKVYTFCSNKDYSDVPERMRKCWIKKNVRKCSKSFGSLVRAAVSQQSAVPYHLGHTSNIQLIVCSHAP